VEVFVDVSHIPKHQLLSKAFFNGGAQSCHHCGGLT
jgi:hypothetical protein